MGRYATPLLFLGAGAFILWHNATYADRLLMLPGIDMVFTAAAKDPELQGQISAYIFLALGGLGLAWAIWKTISTNDSTY